jgi:hypothetical protein
MIINTDNYSIELAGELKDGKMKAEIGPFDLKLDKDQAQLIVHHLSALFGLEYSGTQDIFNRIDDLDPPKENDSGSSDYDIGLYDGYNKAILDILELIAKYYPQVKES